MIKNILISVLLLYPVFVFAAKTDTLQTYSAVMNKSIPAVVITPDGYPSAGEYPAVYLLHGYGGNAFFWLASSALQTFADLCNLLIVLPDGGFASWYFDSPKDSTSRYETYIIDELVPLIDRRYKTRATADGRAISGLSMGGHGALYLAFRHQDVFGAAGSMSGGVDFRPFPDNWELDRRLGVYAQEPENWERNTVVNMLHLLKSATPALIIDCGSEDFFYKVNCRLHDELLYRNIPHDFISRPGVHNLDYWKNAVKYQLLFFNEYFNKNKRN